MPLDLDQDTMTIEIEDRRLTRPLELYARRPTSREQFLYRSALVVRRGKQIKVRTHKVRQEWGQTILTGFKPHPDVRASGRVVSCNEGDEGYRADWRELLAREPLWIDTVAQIMFEPAREKSEIEQGLSIEVEAEEETTPAPPCEGGEPDKTDEDPEVAEELDRPLA